MGELEVLLTHSLAENFSTIQPGDKGPKKRQMALTHQK
jgi:hypothetical protein